MRCKLSGTPLFHLSANVGFDSAVAMSGSFLQLDNRFVGASSVFGWTKKGGKSFSYSGLVAFVVGLGEGASRISVSSRLAIEDRLLETPLKTSSGVYGGGVDGIFGLPKNAPIRICDYQ
jgi:hypothetical protein